MISQSINLKDIVNFFFRGGAKRNVKNETLKCVGAIIYHFKVIQIHELMSKSLENEVQKLPVGVSFDDTLGYLKAQEYDHATNDFQMYINEVLNASEKALQENISKLKFLINQGKIDTVTVKVIKQLGLI